MNSFSEGLQDRNYQKRLACLQEIEKALKTVAEKSEKSEKSELLEFLVIAIKDKHPFVRKETVRILGSLEQEAKPVIASLHFAINDKSLEVRFMVLWAIGKIKDQSSIPYLKAALQDKHHEVQHFAGEALKRITGEVAVYESIAKSRFSWKFFFSMGFVLFIFWIGLLGILFFPSFSSIKEQVFSPKEASSIAKPKKDNFQKTLPLKKVSEEEKRKQLLFALRDEDSTVRLKAVLTIAQFKTPRSEFLPNLLMASKDEIPAIQKNATDIIIRWENSAIPFLIEALKDEDFCERAAEVLTQIQKPAIPFLIEALKDQKTSYWATEVLGKMGKGAIKAIPYLIKNLNAPDKFIRQKTAWSLGQFGPEVVIPLVRELKKGNLGPFKQIISILTALDKNSLVLLLPYLKDPQLSLTIAKILKASKNKGVAVLAAELENPSLGLLILKLLGEMGENAVEAVPTLITMLKKGKRKTRLKVAQVLVQIGPKAISFLMDSLRQGKSSSQIRKILFQIPPNLTIGRNILQQLLKDSGDLAVNEKGVEVSSEQLSKLISFLFHKDDFLRFQAAYTFFCFGEKAAPLLLSLLNKKNLPRNIRKNIHGILKRIGPPFFPLFAAQIENETNSKNLEHYFLVLETLSIAPAQEALFLLRLLEKDPDEKLKYRILVHLERFKLEARPAIPFLIKIYPESSENCRGIILSLFGTLKVSKGVPFLFQALEKESRQSQSIAEKALRRIGTVLPTRIPFLIEKLTHPNPKVRQFAAILLGNTGEKAKIAFPFLIRVLAEDDKKNRFEAHKAIKKIGLPTKEIAPSLVPFLEHKEGRIREYVFNIFKKLNYKVKLAVPVLGRLLQKETNRQWRFRILQLLDKWQAFEAVPSLLLLYDDPYPLFRKRVKRTLIKIGPPSKEVVLQLLPLLAHQNPKIRSLAACALGDIVKIEGLQIPIAFIQLFNDQVYPIRFDVLWALREVPFVPSLTLLLNDQFSSIRAKAAETIGKKGFKTKETANALILLLGDSSAEAQRQASIALLHGGELSIVSLVQSLNEKKIQSNVAKTLSYFGEAAIPFLLVALADKETDIRRGALKSLGYMDRQVILKEDTSLLKAIQKATHDNNFLVRKEAKRLLEKFF